ncbi:MAG: dienelactone hydrolase [Nitrospira sp.]|nr:dienelactone hydrolase [Nitrospira sp.]
MYAMIHMVIALSVLFWFAPSASAEIHQKEVEYKQGDTVMRGLVAWDDAAKGPRPGVLVVHEWWGHNEHARHQAKRLAEAGYVGFALDLFGKGKVTTHPKEAQTFMSEAKKDPAVITARFQAALKQLKQQPSVAPERIAAIGYCFGGGVVLDAARSGADLDAVVSFHGMLATEKPAKEGTVKARILVFTGVADPFVPMEQVADFAQEMKAAGATFEMVAYPGVKHGFTNPDAGKAGMEALEYDAEADQKSWEAMLEMLKEVYH